jgi:hypothetical protein
VKHTIAHRWLVPLGVALALLLPGCGQEREPSRWEQADQASRQNPTAVSKEAVSGGSLNRYFPRPDAPFDLVFKQEKAGFAQASLQRDGRPVATLSISDTANNPSAAEKYRTGSRRLAGYPATSVGSQGTAILVADRFQVQVRSTDPSFGPSDREAWLQRFDLDRLSALR